MLVWQYRRNRLGNREARRRSSCAIWLALSVVLFVALESSVILLYSLMSGFIWSSAIVSAFIVFFYSPFLFLLAAGTDVVSHPHPEAAKCFLRVFFLGLFGLVLSPLAGFGFLISAFGALLIIPMSCLGYFFFVFFVHAKHTITHLESTEIGRGDVATKYRFFRAFVGGLFISKAVVSGVFVGLAIAFRKQDDAHALDMFYVGFAAFFCVWAVCVSLGLVTVFTEHRTPLRCFDAQDALLNQPFSQAIKSFYSGQ
jgi:hypothetical protein